MRSSNGAVAASGERVRLGAGRHSSPAEGACVVELASLLAREEFSDRPQCVCPVIASFLRSWNDRSAYADRERLRPYAARIVATREDRSMTRIRRNICLTWVGIDVGGRPVQRFFTRLAVRFRIAIFCGIGCAVRLDEGAGEYAARVLYGRRDVDAAFALLDTLLAFGAEPPPVPRSSRA